VIRNTAGLLATNRILSAITARQLATAKPCRRGRKLTSSGSTRRLVWGASKARGGSREAYRSAAATGRTESTYTQRTWAKNKEEERRERVSRKRSISCENKTLESFPFKHGTTKGARFLYLYLSRAPEVCRAQRAASVPRASPPSLFVTLRGRATPLAPPPRLAKSGRPVTRSTTTPLAAPLITRRRASRSSKALTARRT